MYICFSQFNTTDLVIKGASYIVGIQFSREPTVRAYVRDWYRKWCALNVRPTKKGLKELDENHILYPLRYLKNKFIKDLEREQFLQLLQVGNFESKISSLEGIGFFCL